MAYSRVRLQQLLLQDQVRYPHLLAFFLVRVYYFLPLPDLRPPLPFQRHMFSLLPLSTLTAFPCSTIDTTPPGAAGQILGNAALIVGEGGCVIEVLRRRETGWLKRLL